MAPQGAARSGEFHQGGKIVTVFANTLPDVLTLES